MRASRGILTLLTLGLAGIAFVLFGDRALAIQDSEEKVLFGPVGIAPGERALVNVYAIGNPDEIGNPNETPWAFVVRIFDRRGTRVQEQRLQLTRGVIGSVELAIQDEENIP